MSDHPPDRRHTQEQVGFFFFGRFYSLAKLGAGLLLASSVVGIVAGCWSFGLQLAGRKVVNTGDATTLQLRDTASAAFQQSRVNAEKIDSMAKSVSIRVSRVEDAVQMLAEIKCKEMRDHQVVYLPPTCTKILREER